MLILDTCSLLWLTADQDQFSHAAIEAIQNAAGKLFISAITAFEIGVKYQKKLLQLPCPLQEWFDKALQYPGIQSIPITHSIALRATQLPKLHSDPADRIILATAIENNYAILTPDKHIAQYSAKIIW